MERIYFDNAATSYPKPAQVCESMLDYIQNVGSNVNRSGYKDAYKAEDILKPDSSYAQCLMEGTVKTLFSPQILLHH